MDYFLQNDYFFATSLNLTGFFLSKSRFAQKAEPRTRIQLNVLLKEKDL